MSLVKTDSSDRDFRSLVKELDSDLKIRDGDEHDFYHQFNKIDALKQVLVAYENETAVGCGAIKEFSKDAMEVKRMYVLPYQRGKGIASKILAGLENWASELGYASCVLETGKKQPEAIALYKKSGYRIIPNYGQYIGIENSICFEKTV
ncbi:GNAT family N-acetyltransferase [Sphingobacterium sp. KB22]|uniref:GNAT family N-acetyltransferase n=1 Tax=Sphingobacterium hungaricum TaxID=2082723 RepID=A0A928UWT1_9SPHI|nr:GNAT family N-acetyltransferase [Sphingobacterium hungaricum]